ncbi:MAG: class 1 fructose-bisphosphatase, partial [Halothece sp. Uz-M2-17]|nr:class 1 fructose-bisphosphatase [Halothece sp. Uz-M2-17]
LYPGTVSKPEGKLRLLYESVPLAFLVEQAGGQASTGTENIMDLVPEKLHGRSPLIIGSPRNVELVESFYKKQDASSQEPAMADEL